VAVGVLRADGHQRHGRAAGGQEARVGVGAAVVRHLEHVGGEVGALGHDARLRRGPQVTGEQHPDAALRGPHHQAQVVGLRARGRLVRVGGQHLEAGRADAAALAGGEHGAFGTRPGDQPVQPGHAVIGGRQRPGGHRADVTSGQRPGQTAHVVGVQVGDQHQREPAHPEPVQAAGHEGAVRTGVDEHALPRPGRQHERVALPDVAGDDHRVRERPAARHLPDRPADHDDPEQCRQRQGPQPRPAQQRPGRTGHQQSEQHRAPGAGRPAGGTVGHRGGPLGDRHQPAHRPPGAPGQHVGGCGGDR
jgi:hypothetical protein